MKQTIPFLLCMATLCLLACKPKPAVDAPVRPLVDANATPETIALYNRLDSLRQVGILLGHQDDLAYGHT